MALFGNLFAVNNEYLDPIIDKLQLNYENNYLKDAEKNLEDLRAMYDRLIMANKLNAKGVDKYSAIITDYTAKVEHMRAKENKSSYWT